MEIVKLADGEIVAVIADVVADRFAIRFANGESMVALGATFRRLEPQRATREERARFVAEILGAAGQEKALALLSETCDDAAEAWQSHDPDRARALTYLARMLRAI